MSIDDFKAHVRNTMCDGEIVLTDDDVEKIELIMQSYLKPEFIMGNNPRCNTSRKQHIEGVGEIEVSFELIHNVINSMNINGDFFLLGDIDHSIINRLNGSPYTKPAVELALKNIDVSQIIMNLTNQQFINLLYN